MLLNVIANALLGDDLQGAIALEHNKVDWSLGGIIVLEPRKAGGKDEEMMRDPQIRYVMRSRRQSKSFRSACREDSLARHPGIQVAMDRLAGKVSAEEVWGMNYAVDSEHRDVGEVVREFRKGKGL
jgi:hypothetical protein